MVVRDGEGATRLVAIEVSGAVSDVEAHQAAMTVANSLLVKTALHGGEPNWGRILAALGRSGVEMAEEKTDVFFGDLEVVRIPLDLYRARNATSRQWLTAGPRDHPFASSTVFLAGDSAVGSPYFQSISLGFECAMYLAGLLAQRDLPVRDMLDRYELHAYKQWLRVYMRSKMIKHNKDLFESLDDPLALLDKLHIY